METKSAPFGYLEFSRVMVGNHAHAHRDVGVGVGSDPTQPGSFWTGSHGFGATAGLDPSWPDPLRYPRAALQRLQQFLFGTVATVRQEPSQLSLDGSALFLLIHFRIEKRVNLKIQIFVRKIWWDLFWKKLRKFNRFLNKIVVWISVLLRH